jgi:hypothetical protein
LLKTFYVCYMQIKGFLCFILIISCTAVLLLVESGCANVVPPSGGPRDTIPPTIVSVDPPHETTNFNAKEIKIVFDEYVELNDVYKNLLISPLPKVMPEVTRKLKTVTVKIKDTLTPNTTYVYNFARVIKDVNEGNPAKDLLYVVSTGNYFDSLQLSGNVKMARTGKADSTLVVMLHSNMDDSAVVQERPRYITRVDTSGTFFFRYLAPGTYRIYALKDESGSYLYNGEQIFAFADSPVVVSATPPEPIQLWAYAPEKKKEDATDAAVEINKKEKRLKFTTNLDASKQDILKAFEMKFESPLKNFDSSKIAVSIGSDFQPFRDYKLTLDSTRRLLTMNVQWLQDTTYNLVLQKDFASDSLDRQLLKADTITFTTKAQKDYGQVRITFVNLDLSKNPLLLLNQGEQTKYSFPLTGDVFQMQYCVPGEYDMEIVYDTNQNGKWDPGEFFVEKRQPEMVTHLDRKLVVKADWETEFEIKLAK